MDFLVNQLTQFYALIPNLDFDLSFGFSFGSNTAAKFEGFLLSHSNSSLSYSRTANELVITSRNNKSDSS